MLCASSWWVGNTHAKEEAVMAEKRHNDTEESGVSFPVMVNSRHLKVHERLMAFVANKEVKPLSSRSASA